jgi:putative ABC transport system permease protein
VVAPETLARLGAAPEVWAVWVKAVEGADTDDLSGDLSAVGVPLDAEVTAELAKRDYVLLQLDIVLIAALALLGIAVVIALVGIGNTLGLSVLERAREHALLRALGLTRRGLRAMLAAESVVLALVATVLGTVVGVAFGWVGVHVLVGSVVDQVQVVVPFGQLLAVVLVAAAAGLLACLMPARRAARVTPAAGLSSD